MAYPLSILFPFVSMILRSTQATGHTARSKALTMLLQGLLLLKQASLSGMGRGVAVIYTEKSFRGQLKKAHRLLKNTPMDTWATGAAFFAHRTQGQQQGGYRRRLDRARGVLGARSLSHCPGTRDAFLPYRRPQRCAQTSANSCRVDDVVRADRDAPNRANPARHR